MVEKTFIQRQWLTVRRQVYPVLVLVVLMWLAEMADWLLPAAWTPDQWGIRSRQITGLSGVALAPFLHEGLVHLLRNTVPLLVLGWLVALSGRWLFIRVAFVTGLTSGLGAWVFGNGDAVHIGASGIVFGAEAGSELLSNGLQTYSQGYDEQGVAGFTTVSARSVPAVENVTASMTALESSS